MSGLTVFIRLHARAGEAEALAAAVVEVVTATRAEAGCLEITAHRSIRSNRKR